VGGDVGAGYPLAGGVGHQQNKESKDARYNKPVNPPAPSALPNAVEMIGITKQFRRVVSGYAGLKGKFNEFLHGKRPQIETQTILNDISLTIAKGEAVALIGRNGEGKSTLLSLLANVLKPDAGTIRFPASADPEHPRIAPLLEVGAGFHPDLTGRDNVFFNGSILGLKKAQLAELYEPIVAWSELLPEKLDSPERTYSSGMKVRLGFAVAIHTDPEIILVDEALAVGDEAFQEKCYAKMAEFRHEKRTIVFVSHDMHAVRRVATRAIWLHKGKITADGDVESVIHAYHSSVGLPD
jgi:ABC-type polysaccharide/polyol phosphate transport system ATPase subunit